MTAIRQVWLILAMSLVATSCMSPPTLELEAAPQRGGIFECLGARAEGQIVADVDDPARVWLVMRPNQRLDLRWPFGFRVRFAPRAEVLSPSGIVVTREGDFVELGGGEVSGLFEVCEVNGVEL
jgi:hypothetical protein